MSRKMTSIHLPGLLMGEGYMDNDECTAESMIAIMRHRAAHFRKVADAIDAAADEYFKIDVVRGVHAKHLIRNLQPGRVVSNG